VDRPGLGADAGLRRDDTAVADAIGARLGRLASRVQVLSGTHAPQVAARAGSHLLVAKDQRGRATVTGVTRLDETLRREEIARMLAGATITDEARTAATG
jgi:DNA repair protein RecN (Recombination protein N)